AADVARVLAIQPAVLVSTYLRYGGDGAATGAKAPAPDVSLSAAEGRVAGAAFWSALEAAARQGGVPAGHVHSGPGKSTRPRPRIDAFLKARLVRARVQLISAGGDSDTQASAATVYESVLLGSNGGSMSHLAGLALCPELIDAYHGADAAAALAALDG